MATQAEQHLLARLEQIEDELDSLRVDLAQHFRAQAPPPLMNKAEAAAWLRTNRRTLEKAINRGHVVPVPFGDGYLIALADLERLVRRQTEATAQDQPMRPRVVAAADG